MTRILRGVGRSHGARGKCGCGRSGHRRTGDSAPPGSDRYQRGWSINDRLLRDPPTKVSCPCLQICAEGKRIMNSRRNSLCGAIVAAAAALALLAPAASAQDWPKGKPIQFVVGFGPGSTTDLVARFIAPKLSEALGQTAGVEKRP